MISHQPIGLHPVCGVLVLVALFAFAACEEEVGWSVDPHAAGIGECISVPEVTGDEAIEVEHIRIVPCSEPHDGVVVETFVVPVVWPEWTRSYPGEETLRQLAQEHCPAKSTLYLYPTRESWSAFPPDLEITCIAQE